MADWRRIRKEYDRTTIDWGRLNAYAKRAAIELSAKHPNIPYWTLMVRQWQREDGIGGGTETLRNVINYTLQRDGSLVVVVTSWSEMLTPTYTPAYWETERTSYQNPFSDDSVMMFDFEAEHYSKNGIYTNRDRTEKVLVHAKGVGLSKALKKLLES